MIVAGHKQYKLVDEALTIRGVDHFIPVIETLRIVQRRHVREYHPLFGDYILTSISSGWKEWLGIRGVSGMLMNDLGMPAQVLPNEMAQLRSMCRGMVFGASETVDENEMEYGQDVKTVAIDHMFSRQTGKYAGRTKSGDLSALFLLFGREQIVEFKSGDLIAV